MIKSKCPNCSEELNCKQYARHTVWSPIVCSNCSRRYHLDRREWFLKSVPTLIAMIANIVNTHWGKLVFAQEIHLLVSIACLVAMLFFSIKFLINIKNIQLVEVK